MFIEGECQTGSGGRRNWMQYATEFMNMPLSGSAGGAANAQTSGTGAASPPTFMSEISKMVREMSAAFTPRQGANQRPGAGGFANSMGGSGGDFENMMGGSGGGTGGMMGGMMGGPGGDFSGMMGGSGEGFGGMRGSGSGGMMGMFGGSGGEAMEYMAGGMGGMGGMGGF